MLFREVIGQYAIKERLIASCKDGRVSHAQLFFGPKGAGVWPLANAFAQYLTCENPGAEDSCGACSSCKKNMKMVHPDVHYVFPVMTTKKLKSPKSSDFITEWRKTALENPYLDYNDWVDVIADSETKQASIMNEEVSDILHKINLKAFEAPYKILIVWMPERMNLTVANKLLKSFEEPPENTVFLLASEQKDLMLQTILSRMQMVKLSRLADEEVSNALIHQNISENRAKEVARYADGDYHLALEMAEQEQSELSHEENFVIWMRLCFNPSKSMSKLLSWVDEISGTSRDQQKSFLFSNIQVLRECVMLNMADGDMVKIDHQQKEDLKAFKNFINENNVDTFVNELNKAHFHVERNANAKILFLDLSLKISRILQIK